MCDRVRDCLCKNRDKKWSYSNQEEWKAFPGYFAFDRVPINIETEKLERKNVNVNFQYKNNVEGSLEKDENNTYFYPNTEDNFVTFNKSKYVLKQLHFHTSAENQVDGLITPMEIHLVHYPITESTGDNNGNPRNLVVALLCNVTEKKGLKFTRTIFSEKPGIISLDFKQLNILENYKHYIFEGGLTTPPFTSNFQWLLFNGNDINKLNININNFNLFRQQYPNNKANELSLYNSNRYVDKNNFLTIYKNK